jgi:hypothetical protein
MNKELLKNALPVPPNGLNQWGGKLQNIFLNQVHRSFEGNAIVTNKKTYSWFRYE